MTKSRFSAETTEVFVRYNIDEAALSRSYDDAFKRAFLASRESDVAEVREYGKHTEALLARARDGLDRLVSALGVRFAASENGMAHTLTKISAQSDVLAALVHEGERYGDAGATVDEELAVLRGHDAWSRILTHRLKVNAAGVRASHRLLLEAEAYAFTAIARDCDREEGYAFALKSLARLAADFAQSLMLLPLATNLREWCCMIDRRLKAAGEARQLEALELYGELAELTLEQLASE